MMILKMLLRFTNQIKEIQNEKKKHQSLQIWQILAINLYL
jgi:hypothetical protein